MAGIKRTPADIAFSYCVRERADWTCERCGTKYPPDRARGLECSHGHTRGKWGVRFVGLNAEALCTGCHFLEGGLARMQRSWTDWQRERVLELANDTAWGQSIRRTKGVGAIARHYRDEFERMKAMRRDGVVGRIEFEDFWP